MADPGKLVVLCGVKGGVGTTMIAANIAARLASTSDVLLIALPGECSGDLGVWFAAEEVVAGARVKEAVAGRIPEALDAVTKSVSGRLRLLVPDSSGLRWDDEELRELLRLAVRRHSRVVVDAGAWRGDTSVSAIVSSVEEAAIALIVLTQDPLAVRRARNLSVALRESGRPVRAVFNRADGAGGRRALDRTQWTEALDGLSIVGTIRESREIPEAMLKGQPFVWADGQSPCGSDIDSLAGVIEDFEPPSLRAGAAPDDSSYQTSAFKEIKRKLHGRFLELSRERAEAFGSKSDRAIRDSFVMLMDDEAVPDLTPGFRERLLKELRDEVTGLGPLQDLIDDPEVTEVMVNGAENIYVERHGRLERVPRALDGDGALKGLIERIVAPLGRRVDEASPLVDARLADGSRVNAIIPPLALGGPCLTIRKFAKRRLTVDNLVDSGSLTPACADFLRACVSGKLNILISGGTGSGKTTLLNILSSFVGETERIITIEDAAELKLPQEHVVSLEARPPNLEGRGAVTIRDLVRNALRMRPDRIVVGEVRGGEALDMLQAMNTGHEGSLSTLHANSPRDGLARLETMVLMAGVNLPLRAIREQISSAVDIVVQIARLKDGSRRIVQVTEVTGLEGDVYRLQDIFICSNEGALTTTGLVPRSAEKLADRGQVLRPGLFD